MAKRKTPIKRALISVYDKTGIVDFAKALVGEFGIEIISTGGTAELLKKNAIPVTLVEEITGFPEMLDGRVKTLHPKIHAAILADRDNPEHMRQLAEMDIEPIDMVVVNLYPFEQTVADPDCTFEQAIEMIDIGGPCLLRAAAKNHKHVIVVPVADLEADLMVDTLRGVLEGVKQQRLLEWAAGAFYLSHLYDAQVYAWLSDRLDSGDDFSEMELVRLVCPDVARYGENAHQTGAMYKRLCTSLSYERTITHASMPTRDIAKGVEGEFGLSYNNYADAHAALELCKELTRYLCAPPSMCGASEISERPHAGLAYTETPHVGPTFQSVIRPVTEERHTLRHLPHIEDPGAHYFVTFRLKGGALPPPDRSIVLEACKHWNRSKMTLHACVVMPDHVHLLLTPHEAAPGKWVSLGEIIRSIKGYSARKINARRGTHGSIWLDESWDRIVRNEPEYGQRLEHIENNPARSGLGDDYPWLWLNHDAWKELAAYDRLESRSHTRESRFHAPGADASRQYICNFVKHTNPCGTGVADDPVEAYRRAYLGDPNAAMGGILACNFAVDEAFATAVMETYPRWGKEAGAGGFFIEVWVAPQFEDAAVEHIRGAKEWGKRVRLLSVGDMGKAPDPKEFEYKSIAGGMLVQTRDLLGLNEEQWKVVTKRSPTEREMHDLRLAWLVCKHTKSNAISICRDGMLIGNGAGQMSRVMSCRIATWLAKEIRHENKLKGSVAASDAFFPFADGPNILMDAGVTAIIQPGGSKRDAETIQACDDHHVAMVFTGTRHFKH